MAYNKVTYGDRTIMDISNDTVTPEQMLNGAIAHDNTGERISGTMPDLTRNAEITVASNPEKKIIPAAKAFRTESSDGERRICLRYGDEPGYIQTDTSLGADYASVADAIDLVPEKIAAGKSVIGVSGAFTSDADALESDILENKVAYVNGEKITGSMPNRGNIDPTVGGISEQYPRVAVWMGGAPQFRTPLVSKERVVCISGPTGYYPNSQAYVAYKACTKTVTPSSEKQVVYSSTADGILENVQVEAVSNLAAANIKQGATVGGVAGNFTNDATATAGDIIVGKTGYVKGVRVDGTIPYKGEGADVPAPESGRTGVGQGNVNGNDYYSIQNIPEGYYKKNANNDWSPEVRVQKSVLREALGITANKIVSGQVIAGITGTGGPYKYFDPNTAGSVIKQVREYTVMDTIFSVSGNPSNLLLGCFYIELSYSNSMSGSQVISSNNYLGAWCFTTLGNYVYNVVTVYNGLYSSAELEAVMHIQVSIEKYSDTQIKVGMMCSRLLNYANVPIVYYMRIRQRGYFIK